MSGIRVNEWLHNSGTGGIWQSSAGNVGIASSVPTSKLVVTGDAKISGITTAKTFIPTESQLSNRNIIINGAMRISQRGTSEASVNNNNGYGEWPDRFRTFLASSAGTWTISQATESPNGFSKSTKWDCTTAGTLAAGTYGGFEQYIEGHNLQRFGKGTSDAKPGVLSFYVKTNKTGTYAIEFRDNDNTRMVGGTYVVSDSNWNRYTVPIPADTTGAWGDDTGSGLWIRWWLVAGSNYTSGTARTAWAAGTTDNVLAAGHTVDLSDSTSNEWHITGVQLEVGQVATPFEHRNITDEEMACYRYFYMHASGAEAQQNNRAPIVTGAMYSATSFYGVIDLPVRMRTTPSLYKVVGTDYFRVYANSGADTCNDLAHQNSTPTTYAINVYDGLSSTLNAGAWAETDDSAARVGFNAEL